MEVFPVRVLAIDQSSVKTGYAIFENSDLTAYSIIDLTYEKDLSKRFHLMCTKLHELITNLEVEFIVFEDVNMQTNVSTLATLARIQGAIIQSILFSRNPYKIYKPSSWRKILGFNQGRGIARKELKQQALDYVKTKYNIETKEDIAEAICIGSAFLIENGGININVK